MTMRERIARAIDDGFWGNLDHYAAHKGMDANEKAQLIAESGRAQQALAKADAVLDAFTDPSDDLLAVMHNALFEERYNGTSAPWIGSAYDALIQAMKDGK